MTEATGFLYPFLDDRSADPAALLADLSRSASAKWAESVELRRTALLEAEQELANAARAVARLVAAGGRVFALGNGGSATDADAFADRGARLMPEVPVRSLATEASVLTAVANDIGVDAMFARPMAACAKAGDIVVAFSTSGGSTNVLAAVEWARRSGILTIGVVGYGGGALGAVVNHCLAVRSQSVHRVQEAQTALSCALVRAVASALVGAESP